MATTISEGAKPGRMMRIQEPKDCRTRQCKSMCHLMFGIVALAADQILRLVVT
jgi:hypothetical protein